MLGRAMRIPTAPIRPLLVLLAATLLAGGALAEAGVHPDADSVEPLRPGSLVPSVQVANLSGEAIDLAQTVREQGALLVFYRGGW
jgi:hypothetical protein